MICQIVKRVVLILVTAYLSCSCCPIINQPMASDNELLEKVENELIDKQKALVAAFTGADDISDTWSIYRRWDQTEKALSRAYLAKAFGNIDLIVREHQYTTNLPEYNDMSRHNPYTGTNLYVELPATTASTEFIILGAHYDSVKESPGASDNATGCALVLGVAQLINKQAVRNKNLIFVFFDQEETGHAGSYAFIQFIEEEGRKIHSVHTADQVGWDQDGDCNIELELPTPELRSLYKKYTDRFGVTLYTTDVTSSDHKEWREAGYPAVGITEEYMHCDTSPHHHEPTDTFDTVNFEYLAFVTFLVQQALKDLITN